MEQWYEEQFNKINQMHQSLDSLTCQLKILRFFARKLGLYDADDYLKNITKDQ